MNMNKTQQGEDTTDRCTRWFRSSAEMLGVYRCYCCCAEVSDSTGVPGKVENGCCCCSEGRSSRCNSTA